MPKPLQHQDQQDLCREARAEDDFEQGTQPFDGEIGRKVGSSSSGGAGSYTEGNYVTAAVWP